MPGENATAQRSGNAGNACPFPLKAINAGKLIPGADLISTFDPNSRAAVIAILEGEPPLVCPKAPYAACMPAPCKQKAGENPVCSCPVFDGVFQLPTLHQSEK